ncbi:MAG: hypothetical protein KDB68_12895 [Planctomycetes bacterium]|nr:hypothetical protein [Planctomycetota bacterium]
MDAERKRRVVDRMARIVAESKIGRGKMGDFLHEPGPSFSTHQYSEITLLLTPKGSDVMRDLVIDLAEYFRSDVGEGKLSNEIWQFVFALFEKNGWDRPDAGSLDFEPLIQGFESHQKEKVETTWVIFPVMGAKVPEGETFRQFGLTFASCDDAGARALVTLSETEASLEGVHSKDLSLVRKCYESGQALCLIAVRGDPESALQKRVSKFGNG